MPLMSRVRSFLSKPFDEQMKALTRKVWAFPFFLGLTHNRSVLLCYMPDSYSSLSQHPEFPSLLRSFVAGNRPANGGDIARLWSFILNVKQVIGDDIEGDFAELGVWRGNTASVLSHYAAEHGRKVYLFDTFEGFSERDLVGVDGNRVKAFHDTSVETVRHILGKSAAVCEFVKGHFPTSLTDSHRELVFSVVSIDCDLYEPMKAGLDFFYQRMRRGGLLLLHDYSSGYWEGAKLAIDEFCSTHGEAPILLPDKSGSALIRKSH